jgi:hypothetical protein
MLCASLRKLYYPKAERKQPAPKLETCFLQVKLPKLFGSFDVWMNTTITDRTWRAEERVPHLLCLAEERIRSTQSSSLHICPH